QYAVTAAFQPLFLERPTGVHRDAIAWTRAHLPAESLIVADAWAEPMLLEPGSDRIAFTGLARTVLNPSAVEYRLSSAETRSLAAPAAGSVVRRWAAGGTEVALVKTGRRGATEAALLDGSSQYIARRFERAGAVTSLDGTVSARSQADAMLRAVWSNDRAGFTPIWRSTHEQ